MQNKKADVMTTKEVANYLRLSEVTIRRLVRTAGLPCVEACRFMRYYKPEVDRWLPSRSRFKD